jgi:glycosyltransferase involved in cell wall biosynthesis
MTPLKVSVIIPNYNHAPYLEQRIASVLNQTFQNFEVIILDDCSTDNSREVIEKFRNHPKVVHIEYNSVNSGSTFKQWQKGIKLARGEWIWIAESDDWCEHSLLSELTENIQKHDVISYCGSALIKDGHIGIISLPYYKKRIQGTEFIKNHMTKGNSISNASMAIFRKECYKNIRLNFLELRYCGDWLFWCEIAKQGNVIISGKILNYFRKHSNDVTTRAMQDGTYFKERLQILDYLLTDKYLDNKKYYQIIYNDHKQILRRYKNKKWSKIYAQKVPFLAKIRIRIGRLYYRIIRVFNAAFK